MIDMDISFGDSPWEAWMDRKRYGDSLSAAQLLTFLEEETEEGVEEAFAALEDRGLKLDVTTLPSRQFVGQAALRLRQEEQMAKENVALKDLGPNDPLRLYLEEIASLPPAEETEELLRQAADGGEKAQEILTGAGLRRVAEIAKEFTGYDVLLMDLIQVRKTLEAEATRLAAQNATEEDLKKIEHFALERRSLCARYRDDLKAVREELNALDYDFHKSIAEASKNKVIAAFILSIHSTFTEHQNRVSARAQIADQVNKLHLEIVEALKKRDQKLAKTLMYEHLQMVEDSLSSVISAQKGS